MSDRFTSMIDCTKAGGSESFMVLLIPLQGYSNGSVEDKALNSTWLVAGSAYSDSDFGSLQEAVERSDRQARMKAMSARKETLSRRSLLQA